MKQRIFFLLTGIFLLSMTIGSCSKDDEPITDNDKIVGTWNLVKRDGGFSGETIDIEAGTVVVSFTANGEMTVYDKTDNHYFFSSGTYDYYFLDSTQNPANAIVLRTKEGVVFSHFYYSFQDNTLRLSQQAFDGFNYTFMKVK